MGCDIHTVLQKKDETGKFISIDHGLLDGRNYELFGFLSEVRGMMPPGYSGIAEDGLPDDFVVDSQGRHEIINNNGYIEKVWMGDHTFGHVSLEDLITAEYPYPKPSPADRFEVEKHSKGYTVMFLEDDEIDTGAEIRELQDSLRMIFGHSGSYTDNATGKTIEYGAQNYRLVIGYDS